MKASARQRSTLMGRAARHSRRSELDDFEDDCASTCDCCGCDEQKCQDRCMVVLVMSLIMIPFLTIVFFIIVPWLGFSLYGKASIIFFTFLVGMAVWSYFKTLNTQPGFVPMDWQPQALPDGTAEARTFCDKCNHHRPARAHHCAICKRCVEKMDHHCGFVANCVGSKNHRFFYQFVVYTTLALVAAVGFMLGRALSFTKLADDVDPQESLVLVLHAVILVPLLLALCCLCCFQTSLISKNMTTVENSEYARTIYYKRRDRQRRLERGLALEAVDEIPALETPHDKGLLANFRALGCGNRPTLWLFPIDDHEMKVS